MTRCRRSCRARPGEQRLNHVGELGLDLRLELDEHRTIETVPGPRQAVPGFLFAGGDTMSWSVSFAGRSKRGVIEQAEKCYAPLAVKLLIVDAVKGIQTEFDAITVQGSGHQADGESYEVSTCTLEVKPIKLPK
jgi:hypothetical protein